MARLIYASNMSLDGCTEDEHGRFDWAPPDEEVFAFTTDIMRSADTYLYGRLMYQTMAVWETEPDLAKRSDLTAAFANVWQAAVGRRKGPEICSVKQSRNSPRLKRKESYPDVNLLSNSAAKLETGSTTNPDALSVRFGATCKS